LSIGLPVLYFELFLWPLDCLYFILYFKVQNNVQAIQWPKKKYKIKYQQSND
jgi:hypothetical protein